ncbi:methyltransferase family protein [Aliiruegeria haliotis]|nr:isoprenylcysteine carboxylmethyltransferase family protein [Aliiruegeria haliotis]
MPVLKWLDIPPLWLLLFAVLARIQATRLPVGVIDHPLVDLLAGLLLGGGLLLILVALVQLRQNRTTIIPHQPAQHMVSNGVFSRSRNPVYLGDTLVLTGLILHWSAWPSLVLVPLFMWVITDRFILAEESMLREKFGPQWDAWSDKTRRWI